MAKSRAIGMKLRFLVKVGDLVTIGWHEDPIDLGLVIEKSVTTFYVYWFGIRRRYTYSADEEDAVDLFSEC